MNLKTLMKRDQNLKKAILKVLKNRVMKPAKETKLKKESTLKKKMKEHQRKTCYL